MKVFPVFLVLFAVTALGPFNPAPFAIEASFLSAQTPEQLRRQAEQQLGRQLSDDEILRRLQESGMTPAEIRRELERRGVDPTAADPWLRVLEGRSDRVPPGTDRMSILEIMAGREADRDRFRPGFDMFLELEPEPGPPVFGRALFRRATYQFEPVIHGPVPPNYRVGPGDELLLVMTGDVEQAYELRVSREGWVVIPDVGRITVHGRTMEQIREALFDQLSRRFSGIRRGPDATTHFDVTLGRLRTNEVFVIGDVERPSAYQISSLGNVLTALYQAGGPTRSGSFREVHVNRGGQTVARVDLYEYLVQGRASENIRLEHGDIVFVPVAERQVEVSGSVVRPGIYELRAGEELRDVLRYAGGERPDAELRRVQIERVLPLEERAPGRDRAMLDVPLGRLDDPTAEPITMRPGDRITVFAVLEDADNEVRVSGGVWRPGTFGVRDGDRLWDVIERAGGLLPDVVEGRAQIQRVQADWTRRLIPVSLARGEQGRPLENPVLEGRDEVLVYAARDLRETRQVSIGGWVRDPGIYPYSDGMTVADLILRAGGLRTGAYLAEAEVSRVVMQQDRTPNLTETLGVPLDSALVFDRSRPGARENPDGDFSRTQAGSFELQNMDAIYVRKAPGFDPQQRVMVTGEVLFPGPYSISGRTERLSDLLERAGGLTEEGYLEGFQLWRVRDRDDSPEAERERLAGLAGVLGTEMDEVRDWNLEGDRERRMIGARIAELERRLDRETDPERIEELEEDLERLHRLEEEGRLERERPEEAAVERTRVGIDFAEVVRNPESRHNILVQPNDSIYVPGFIPTVEVRGAVAASTQVLYRPGASFNYYIRQAGGYVENADERRVRLQFANGEVATRGRRFLFIGGGIARPDPGSVITVPERDPRDGIELGQVVGLVSTSLTALATLIIAINR